jgi:hypothetical protein
MMPTGVIFVILASILVSAFLLFSVRFRPSSTVDSGVVTTEDHGTLLYECFTAFDDYCAQRGIKYYPFGGTAIGALRNQPGGHMPWDDDIDVIVSLEDKQMFMEADLEAGRFPLDVRDIGFWQCRLKDPRRCKSVKDFYLDVFFLAKGPNGTYVLDSCEFLKHIRPHRKEFHESCVPCTFWGRRAQCPVNVMDSMYPDWRHSIRRWSHTGDASGPRSLSVSDPANALLLKPFINCHIAQAMGGTKKCDNSCYDL